MFPNHVRYLVAGRRRMCHLTSPPPPPRLKLRMQKKAFYKAQFFSITKKTRAIGARNITLSCGFSQISIALPALGRISKSYMYITGAPTIACLACTLQQVQTSHVAAGWPNEAGYKTANWNRCLLHVTLADLPQSTGTL